MLDRDAALLEAALARAPVVALVGPRQVGKSTLARQLADRRQLPSMRRFDLERQADRAALVDPDALLEQLGPGLVLFDEVQFVPQLFQSLRVAVDARRAAGHRFGQFLVLGSASLDLLQGAAESLAGRLEVVELKPLLLSEVAPIPADTLFLRGGYPESLLAASDANSLVWREQFLRTHLERDIAFFAPRLPRETLRRLWTMLAHLQGSELNVSNLARSLETSAQSVSRYLDLLCDLFLVRRLPAFATNIGKRLRKSPRVYVRDSGMVHALLGIEQMTQLLGHPVLGGSFEGWVIEQLLAAGGMRAHGSYLRSQDGAEIDLLLELRGQRIAIEIKRSAASRPSRGFHLAATEIAAGERWLVHGGERSFPLGDTAQALSLAEACARLRQIDTGPA